MSFRSLILALALVAVLPGSARADHTPACGAAAQTSGTAPGLVTCDSIRPGGRLQGGCTLNFVFAGTDDRAYIGTAGHCAVRDAERTWEPGGGPVASDMHGARIGEYAYAIHLRPHDFALIRLDPGIQPDPQTAHFGGPTGVNDERGAEPAVLRFVGWGRPTDPWPATTARPFLAQHLCDADEIGGVAVALGGDSGSPVVDTEGRAVGVFVGAIVDTDPAPQCPIQGARVTRLPPQIARAEAALGISLTLRTAPTG